MNASNLIAGCAVMIAVVSLAVSIFEARATRRHNYQSVRPILQMVSFRNNLEERASLKLENVGLGPAIIVCSSVSLDGIKLGEWGHTSYEHIFAAETLKPGYSVRDKGDVIPAGQHINLLFINRYKEPEHRQFWDLIVSRLRLEFEYESVYGHEAFKAVKDPR